MTSWRVLITEEMKEHDDTWDNVESIALAADKYQYTHEPSLDRLFDPGFGCPEGDFFTVWTKTRVYFPKEYDGAESCCSVARHPDGVATEHV